MDNARENDNEMVAVGDWSDFWENWSGVKELVFLSEKRGLLLESERIFYKAFFSHVINKFIAPDPLSICTVNFELF